MEFRKDDLLKLYWYMTLSRQWDAQMVDSYHRRKCVTFLHSGQGHEAIGVGMCTFLRKDDWLLGSHRGRAHAIAKGVELGPMIAEWYGRQTGISKGKGGEHFGKVALGVVGHVCQPYLQDMIVSDGSAADSPWGRTCQL